MAGPTLSLATTQPVELIPPPSKPPTAYEVRMRASVGDTVLLTGYGAQGKPLLEIRLPRAKMCEALVRRMERWCRANDEQPDLRVVR